MMAELRPRWCGCGALSVWRQENVWGEVVWVQEFGRMSQAEGRAASGTSPA